MANKIVEIMQYNGSTNDNLIPQKAQQADNATNAINAQNAVIGQYASSDTSKGTIEQRLETAGIVYEDDISLSVSFITPVNNIIKKKGSKGICLIDFEGDVNTAFSIPSTAAGVQIATVPSNFIPSTSDSDIRIGYGYSSNQGKVFICRLKDFNRIVLVTPPSVGTLTIQNGERIFFICSYSI